MSSRRSWSIPLAVVGVLAAAGSLVVPRGRTVSEAHFRAVLTHRKSTDRKGASPVASDQQQVEQQDSDEQKSQQDSDQHDSDEQKSQQDSDQQDDRPHSEKPEVEEEHEEKAKEMRKEYVEKRPTVILPGSGGTVAGTSVNEWLDDDGNPKFADESGSAGDTSDSDSTNRGRSDDNDSTDRGRSDDNDSTDRGRSDDNDSTDRGRSDDNDSTDRGRSDDNDSTDRGKSDDKSYGDTVKDDKRKETRGYGRRTTRPRPKKSRTTRPRPTRIRPTTRTRTTPRPTTRTRTRPGANDNRSARFSVFYRPVSTVTCATLEGAADGT